MNELVVILGKVCGVGSVIAGRDRRGICCEIRYDLEMRGSGLNSAAGMVLGIARTVYRGVLHA